MNLQKDVEIIQNKGFKSGYNPFTIIACFSILLSLWIPAEMFADDFSDHIRDVFTATRGIDAGSSSMLVIDLSDGGVIGEYNSSLPLIPASIMKCITTATLMSEAGHERQFETKVYTDGEIEDGILKGNIIIEGSGDPSLNSRYLPEGGNICEEITTALLEKGIGCVQGRIIIDENIWSGPAVPPSWASGDLSQAYGTGSHGLNFEDNASGKSSVANPSAIFQARMKAIFMKAGISLDNEDLREGSRKLLTVHRSLPLDDVMRSCMMRSDNQYAEALLRTFAVLKGKDGSTSRAADLEKQYWSKRKKPLKGVEIVDGSGLSRSNRMTADFMASVLSDMSTDVYYASLFPLAGQEGTLRNFLAGTPLDSYVALKTGSMKGIQCYAGYKLDENYAPTHVIVVMLNNMTDRASARKGVSKILLDIFAPESVINNSDTENADD